MKQRIYIFLDIWKIQWLPAQAEAVRSDHYTKHCERADALHRIKTSRNLHPARLLPDFMWEHRPRLFSPADLASNGIASSFINFVVDNCIKLESRHNYSKGSGEDPYGTGIWHWNHLDNMYSNMIIVPSAIRKIW